MSSLFAIILLIVWFGFSIFLKKLNMRFFLFLWGGIGLFSFFMYFGTGTLDKLLAQGVTYVMYTLGLLTNWFATYPMYSMMTIYHGTEAISFFIDYECSGFIETLVYLCLLIFYPAYNYMEKSILAAVGVLYVSVSNIIRLLVITIIIKAFGTPVFFFSHTIFGRLVFFSLMVLLYYFVFTKPHILRQRVGNLSYK